MTALSLSFRNLKQQTQTNSLVATHQQPHHLGRPDHLLPPHPLTSARLHSSLLSRLPLVAKVDGLAAERALALAEGKGVLGSSEILVGGLRSPPIVAYGDRTPATRRRELRGRASNEHRRRECHRSKLAPQFASLPSLSLIPNLHFIGFAPLVRSPSNSVLTALRHFPSPYFIQLTPLTRAPCSPSSPWPVSSRLPLGQ
jgi:hypothetical protein